LLEIDGTVDKSGHNFNQIVAKIDADKGFADLIIRNASWFPRLARKEKTIAFFQDLPRDARKDDVVFNADCVVFNSHYTLGAYQNDLDKIKRYEVIPIGVNGKIFTPYQPCLTRFAQSGPTTGIFVGDYNATKNTKTFEGVARHRKDLRFFYVSKAGHRINLPNVNNIVGGVGEAEMADLYNESDFVIMCSPVETLHLSSIEGAMCDKPVVGTRTGWLADYFSDTAGVIVDDIESIDEYSKAIDSIFDNREAFGPKAHMETTSFTWENCKATWRKLIEEMAT